MSAIDIGSDIVANAGEPTKTVEEMKELMGMDTETVAEQAPAPVTESTTVKASPDIASAFVVEPATAPEPVEVSEPEVFDPAIHCQDSFGNPIKTSKGKFRKKPGRKGETAKEQVKATQYESFTCAAPVSTVSMVQMMLDSVTMVTAKILGDEWKMSTDERSVLTDAYARYIHYKGWDGAMSPEAFVIGVTATYIMPRLLSGGVIEKLLGLGKKDAHANPRPNGVGQNNTRESNRSANGTSGNNRNSVGPITNGLGGTIEISTLRGPTNQRSG